MNSKQPLPNPGSKEAIGQGCTCAVIDNHYGKGFGRPPKFWISGDCPLHGLPNNQVPPLEKEPTPSYKGLGD